MVTRRTTRASSKALSSRENSPVVSTSETSKSPTPGRSRRSLNTPLPAVGLKSSTAYGTNSNAQSTRLSAPRIDSDMKNVLREILKTEKDRDISNRQSVSPTVPTSMKSGEPNKTTPERSFEMESKIFIGAGLESSEVDPEEIYPVHQNNSSSSHESSDDATCDDHYLKSESFALNPNRPDTHVGPNRDLITFGLFKYLDTVIGSASFWKFTLILATIALLFFTPVLENLHFYTSRLPENPLNYTARVIPINEKTLINQRLSKLEVDVSRLPKVINTLNTRTIKELEDILPNAIVMKSADGKLQINQDFWLALQDKIYTDIVFDLLQLGTSQSVERDLYTINQTLWENFCEQNTHKLEQLNEKKITDRFPQLLRERTIVSRNKFIDIIRQNWEQNSAPINEKMKTMLIEIKQLIEDKNSKLSSLSKEDLERLGEELRKYLPNAELQAAAHVNILSATDRINARINHFSRYTGALIDVAKTSSNYEFPSQARIWYIERAYRSLMRNPVPRPNPPEIALTKWEEAGECWCSPTQDEGGFGPSIGVILGNQIYPEEVVIENIQSSLSLEPGSAPKILELFAAIEDPEIRSVILQQSQKQFPSLNHDLDHKLNDYVRIAAWIYNLDSSYTTQTHEIPLDLKAFGVGTSRLLLRIKSNWSKNKVSYTCLYRVRLHGTIVQRHSKADL